jgi:hypothetical protein
MSELLHLLAIAIVLAILFYVASRVPVPAPFAWIPWVVVAIIALAVLLPFLGLHLPA